MKKLLMLLTLMGFVVAAPLGAMAAEKEINCCYGSGLCERMTKADCRKNKGKVVKDCSLCGGGWGSFYQERGRPR